MQRKLAKKVTQILATSATSARHTWIVITWACISRRLLTDTTCWWEAVDGIAGRNKCCMALRFCGSKLAIKFFVRKFLNFAIFMHIVHVHVHVYAHIFSKIVKITKLKTHKMKHYTVLTISLTFFLQWYMYDIYTCTCVVYTLIRKALHVQKTWYGMMSSVYFKPCTQKKICVCNVSVSFLLTYLLPSKRHLHAHVHVHCSCTWKIFVKRTSFMR